MSKLHLNEVYENEVIFFEPGSLYQYCTFTDCTLVYYEFGPMATIHSSVFIGSKRYMSFSSYLAEFNKDQEELPPRKFTDFIRSCKKVPWYINKGKKW